jgi:hypothetical protein
MTATMVLKAPGAGERDITADEVMAVLGAAGVVYGIHYDAILKSIENRRYDQPVTIAAGTPPQEGKPAVLLCFCDSVRYAFASPDRDERFDFDNISIIQRVEAGTLLARKLPPTPGISGMGVDGKEIPAPEMCDPSFIAGENTRVTEDGLHLVAATDGTVIWREGVIEVKDLALVDRDVDHVVGNLDFPGSVKVAGSVRTGFRLDVGGDLEIDGNVEDCHIFCRGNVLIKGGCFGRGYGRIHADGDILVRFAEGHRIKAGGDVFVGGELLHCRVTAGRRVLVRGGSGKIVGGTIQAGTEIRASVIGADTGTTTLLIIASERELLRQYHETVREIERLKADQERVRLNLSNLFRRSQTGKLLADKLDALEKLKEFQQSIPTALAELRARKAALETQLGQLKEALIIVEDTLYPGVEVRFGDVYRHINTVRNRCRLLREGNQIIISEFHPIPVGTLNGVETS